jgi:two-component system, OmpR family, alkaline phosphatase synthesis response regulator PhoP
MQEYVVIVVSSTHEAFETIRKGLLPDDYALTSALSGREALDKVRAGMTDLVVVDPPLCDMDGLNLVRLLKSHPTTRHIPVIMLTADSADARKIEAAESKPDEYLTKPFSPTACAAVIQAVLVGTMHFHPNHAAITVGDLRIDPPRFRVQLGLNDIDLTVTEFRILQLLASRPGQVFVRDQIIAVTRGDYRQVTDRSVDVHITGIRKKFGDYGDLIETVRGVGYRLKPEEPVIEGNRSPAQEAF